MKSRSLERRFGDGPVQAALDYLAAHPNATGEEVDAYLGKKGLSLNEQSRPVAEVKKRKDAERVGDESVEIVLTMLDELYFVRDIRLTEKNGMENAMWGDIAFNLLGSISMKGLGEIAVEVKSSEFGVKEYRDEIKRRLFAKYGGLRKAEFEVVENQIDLVMIKDKIILLNARREDLRNEFLLQLGKILDYWFAHLRQS